MAYKNTNEKSAFDDIEYMEDENGLFVPCVEITPDPYEKYIYMRKIGHYGTLYKWWILKHYPYRREDWDFTAREIDYLAEKRIPQLEEIFDKDHPKPDDSDFKEVVKWQTERSMYIEKRICEELVYIKPEIVRWAKLDEKRKQRRNDPEYAEFYNTDKYDDIHLQHANFDGDEVYLYEKAEQARQLEEDIKNGIFW